MGKPAATDRPYLPSLSHSFTLDGLIHCKTEAQAQTLKAELAVRLAECGLELHPAKTRIVYCKGGSRKGQYPNTSLIFSATPFGRVW
jgi:RNA-directed DNA polymerase